MIKFKENINLIQSASIKISYKKYKNPLKDVKQEKKPLIKRNSLNLLNFLLIKKPTKNDPRIEITMLLPINILKKVPR